MGSTIYVDDFFYYFGKYDHMQLFLNYLNGQHPNIAFTKESAINNVLPVLDVKITIDNNKFIINVLRKPIPTGLRSIFFIFHSFYLQNKFIK